MVTLTAWAKTGLGPVDLPAKRAVLDKGLVALTDVPVDLCQIHNLSEVKVKGTEAQVSSIDYIELSRGDERAYYVVSGPVRMAAGDVAVIPVVQDPFLTMRAYGNFPSARGHMIRSSRQRGYTGRNCIIDPLMSPSFPPLRQFLTAFDPEDDGGREAGYYHVVASTVNLNKPTDSQWNPNDLYHVDFATGKVTASWLPEKSDETEVVVELEINEADGPVTFRTVTSGYGLYLNPPSSVLKALWGINGASSILGSYALPKNLFEITKTGSTFISSIKMKSKKVEFGTIFQTPEQLYADYSGPDADLVKNNANLITFSDRYRIGILSPVSGSQQISKGYSTTGTVICVADPRLHGKPYFIMPEAVKEGQTAVLAYNMAQLFSRGVPGGEWESVPLSFSGASGWASEQAAFVLRDDMQTHLTQYKNDYAMYDAPGQLLNQGVSAITGNINWENADYIQSKRATAGHRNTPYIDSITPIPDQSGLLSSALGVVGNGIGALGRMWGISDETLAPVSSASRNNLVRSQERNRGLSQYMLTNHYVAPTTTGIPATTWQGLIGNGVIIYVEYPDPEDVKKWARMAKYFGVAEDSYPNKIINLNLPVSKDDPMTYVQASLRFIQISPYAPVSAALIADAEAALEIGVRFWQVLPCDYKGDS